MVNFCRTPARYRRVATRAVRGEARCLVIGIHGSVKVRLVTAYAVRRSIGVIAGGMTRSAIRNIVALGEREETVVDGRRTPAGYRRVTAGTVRGEARCLVIGIHGGIKVRLVTAHAICGGIGVIAGGVTRRTIRNSMPLR